MSQSMDTLTVEIAQRPVTVHLSDAAARSLGAREKPLYVQLELYFSCLIRFKVRFSDQPLDDNAVAAAEQMYISFRPVMTAQCGRDYEGEEPPFTEFPIENAKAFVPREVRIDYRRGRWEGEFAYQ